MDNYGTGTVTIRTGHRIIRGQVLLTANDSKGKCPVRIVTELKLGEQIK